MSNDDKRMIRMTLEYDGTDYAGWQRQKNVNSIQQTVEEALARHLREEIRVTASGRTDSGVHAMAQVVSFPTTSKIPGPAIGRGLMLHMPGDISVIRSEDAAPDFDARRDARLRWYRFFLSNRSPRPAVGSRYLTHVPKKLDLDRMRQAAELLSGEHDFVAFRAATCTAKRTKLTMKPIEITVLPDNIIQIDYRCRSFLHNMVRILTGTLVAAAQRKIANDDITAMLETGKRHQLAVTVPPNGLFLYRVFYEEDLKS